MGLCAFGLLLSLTVGAPGGLAGVLLVLLLLPSEEER